MHARQKYLKTIQPDEQLPQIDDAEIVVVIPAFAEGDISEVLQSVQRALPDAWTIVVVNDSSTEHLRSNEITAEICTEFPNTIAIDRYTTPFVGGVGAARRVGMDNALWLSRRLDDAWIVSLDADTTIDGDYASALRSAESPAVLCRYRHPLTNDAIVHYETWMRLHELALSHASSPFAFSALGSRFAVRHSAYCAVSGMPRRQAGEDFHFLNKVVKTFGASGIERVSVVVSPSDRASERVPFGTGPSVSQNAVSHRDMPSFQIFEELRIAYASIREEQSYDGPFADFARSLKGHEIIEGLKGAHDFETRFFQIWDGVAEIRYIHERETKLGRQSFDAFTQQLLGRQTESPLERLQLLRTFNGTLEA